METQTPKKNTPMAGVTWEVIVFDGMQWFRTPGCVWDTAEEARNAAERITVAPVRIETTRDLDRYGMPRQGPPGYRK